MLRWKTRIRRSRRQMRRSIKYEEHEAVLPSMRGMSEISKPNATAAATKDTVVVNNQKYHADGSGHTGAALSPCKQ